MVIKQSVAYGIVESIEELWKEQEFQDFTVVVDDTEVKCHSFLLAACSKFFRALFRSGMKETIHKSVSLPDISKETFDLIIKAVYTGCDILTKDNVFDIWHASNQLQIQFLVNECETFVIDNISLNNYEKIYRHARAFHSTTVLHNTHAFMRTHFEEFWRTETFPELQYHEFFPMVESQDLNVSSEDTVVESILRWVFRSQPRPSVSQVAKKSNKSPERDEDEDSDENESENKSETANNAESDNSCNNTESNDVNVTFKKQCLSQADDTVNQDKMNQGQDNRWCHIAELMKSARLCLVSPECLEALLRNTVLMENHDVKETIYKANFYQLQAGRRHGTVLKAALHRHSSDFVNGFLFCTASREAHVHLRRSTIGKKIKLESVSSGNGYDFSDNLKSVVVFDNSPFVLISNRYRTFANKCKAGLMTYKKNEWQSTIALPGDSHAAIVSCADYIFIFDTKCMRVCKLNPLCEDVELQQCASCSYPIEIVSVIEFDKRILVFSSETNNGVDETAVHCFDPRCQTWTRLNNIEGPAKQITRVYDDDTKYILQTNGTLWKVTKDDTGNIDFTLNCRLWNEQCQIWGAVLIGDTFYICGEQQLKNIFGKSNKSIDIAGRKKNIEIWSEPSPCFAFLPIILPKRYLPPANNGTSLLR